MLQDVRILNDLASCWYPEVPRTQNLMSLKNAMSEVVRLFRAYEIAISGFQQKSQVLVSIRAVLKLAACCNLYNSLNLDPF